MIYLIDFDDRSVIFKAEDTASALVDSYLSKNKLEIAIAVVSSPDEIELQLSLEEMLVVINKLMTNGNLKIYDESEAAGKLWRLLENHKDTIPTFNKRSSIANKVSQEDKPVKTKKDKAVKPKRLTTSALDGKIFIIGDVEPKQGTIHHIHYSFIEDNLGEASFEELVDNFLLETDGDEKKARGYLTGAIKKNFIQILEQ